MTVETFLNSLRTGGTAYTYRHGIRKLLEGLYGQGVLSSLGARYLSELKDGKRDLPADLKEEFKDLAPTTQAAYRSAVIEWLRDEDIDLTDKTLRCIRKGRPKVRTSTRQEPLTLDIIREMLTFSDIRSRALLLMLISSGCRAGEIASLDLDDLELDKTPARFYDRDTKNGESRVAFLSSEAKTAVEDYLSQRENYIQRASQKDPTMMLKRFGKVWARVENDNRLFPYGLNWIDDIFREMITKAGHAKKDRVTGRNTITPHACRAFFVTKMKSGGVPDACVEKLVGHEGGYLGREYFKVGEEEQAASYAKGEWSITVGRRGDVPLSTSEAERVAIQKETQTEIAALKDAVAMLKGMVMVEEQAGRDERETLERATGTTLRAVLLKEANEVRRRSGLPPATQ